MSSKSNSGTRRVVTEKDKARSALIRLAAELVKGGGLPDPELEEFRPMGKNAVRAMRREQQQHVRALKRAANLLGR